MTSIVNVFDRRSLVAVSTRPSFDSSIVQPPVAVGAGGARQVDADRDLHVGQQGVDERMLRALVDGVDGAAVLRADAGDRRAGHGLGAAALVDDGVGVQRAAGDVVGSDLVDGLAVGVGCLGEVEQLAVGAERVER